MATKTPSSSFELWRFPRVQQVTGKSRSAISRDVEAGDFPSPIDIGAHTVAWDSREVLAWIERRRARSRDRVKKPGGHTDG